MSQLFALKMTNDIFCWKARCCFVGMICCIQFCFLLECSVLETAAGLLPEHVKYILHWSVLHCVNTHSNSKASSKSSKDQAKTHPQVNG